MTKKLASLVFTLIVMIVLYTFYKGLKIEVNYNTSDLINKKIESFSIKSFNENSLFSEEDLKKNNFSLINFWASWCVPCRLEHENLMKLKELSNLKIIGVNYKDIKKNASEYLVDLGNPYDVLLIDTDGKQSVNFGIYGIPESILINSELMVLKKYIGPLMDKYLLEIKKEINK